MRSIRSILILIILAGMAPSAECAEISVLVDNYQRLSRSTPYRLVEKIPLGFDTYHPQGMVQFEDFFLLSSVRVMDRAKGKGEGYIFKVDNTGKKIGEVRVGEGAMYHPGGIDFDGINVWVSVAEYRPYSKSVIYTVNPNSLEKKEQFRFSDHIGAVSHVADYNLLYGVSWGSRVIYRWKTDKKGNVIAPEEPLVTPNPIQYIDYQDMQWVRGTPYVFMGGLAGYRSKAKDRAGVSVGGIDLWDMVKREGVSFNPIPLWTDSGKSMNQNPFYITSDNGGMVFSFIPEDNRSTLYRYRAKTP